MPCPLCAVVPWSMQLASKVPSLPPTLGLCNAGLMQSRHSCAMQVRHASVWMVVVDQKWEPQKGYRAYGTIGWDARAPCIPFLKEGDAAISPSDGIIRHGRATSIIDKVRRRSRKEQRG
jgi:hypothetical protein